MNHARGAAGRKAPQRIAAVIPAHNVGHDVAATVRACRAIPGVDLLIVVDDGSADDTGRAARAAGAVVVRHSVERGRASAIETGVKVAAMRDRADGPARHLLILSPDLGESAVEATALVEAVNSGLADCASSVPPGERKAQNARAQRIARSLIRRKTGWDSHNPMSYQRCITREALKAAMPFLNRYALEVAMTIDVLCAGFSVVEIPCNFVHSGADKSLGSLNRSARMADNVMAVLRQAFHRGALPAGAGSARAQAIGQPYPRPARERGGEGDADTTDS